MAFSHIAVITAVLLCPPCAVVAALSADAGHRRAALRRLDRGLRTATVTPPEDGLPGIEQLAADLRRLDRQRRGGPTCTSVRWKQAVLKAYDDRLQRACRCLAVTEHLDDLAGLDREIERVRVEAELQAAGLSLRSVPHR